MNDGNGETSKKRRFAASSRADLEDLAALVRLHATGAKMAYLVGMANNLRLMMPLGRIGFALAFVKAFARFARLLGRGSAVPPEVGFWSAMQRKDPAAVVAMRDQTLDHMLRGRDREDVDSVGGWSQRELDSFVAMVSPMLPPGATAPRTAPRGEIAAPPPGSTFRETLRAMAEKGRVGP